MLGASTVRVWPSSSAPLRRCGRCSNYGSRLRSRLCLASELLPVSPPGASTWLSLFCFVFLCFRNVSGQGKTNLNSLDGWLKMTAPRNHGSSLDVFLTDTYLCKNCVRNRTVVQWINTISPSGDPPGRKVRKVLGNVMVFTNSGNHQGRILKIPEDS